MPALERRQIIGMVGARRLERRQFRARLRCGVGGIERCAVCGQRRARGV